MSYSTIIHSVFLYVLDINHHHSNTTITKVPAMKAVTAKSIDSIAQNLTGKSEDYPAALGGSVILDTYLQFMAENSFGLLNQINF